MRRLLTLLVLVLAHLAALAHPTAAAHPAPKPATAHTTTTPTATATAAATTTRRQIIPLYVYPGPTWDYACAHAAAGSILIANPNNGPGKRASADYARQIASCQAAGQQVIGYVDTLYGRRTLAAVRADIDSWYAQYRVDGIFIDEESHNPTDATNKTDKAAASAYYGTLFDYVNAKDATRNLVVENPGDTAETDWQLNSADVVVVFEGPFRDGTTLDLQHYAAPAWVTSYPDPTRIGMLVFGTPTDSFPAACSTLNAAGAGTTFVESDPTGYWDKPLSNAEIDANRTYCG